MNTAAEYDLAIIGGGIHGVGIAQAGAAAGYKVMLLEQQDIAAGTSSRSSKLIHGGLRYLESMQLSLVRESLRERETLLHIAPDLVQLTPFYIPVYRDTTRRPWQIRAGLSLYAVLGGLRSAARFREVAQRQWGRLDGLRTEGLDAVYQYWDAQTDDAALARAVMASAQELGADLLCPAHFTGARLEQDHYHIDYESAGKQHSCRAKTLVNAAGPWVNQVQQAISPQPSQREIELVQGAHIIVPGQLQWGIYYVEAIQDHRAVFVMPWHEGILVGTTESLYQGDPAKVTPLDSEIAYLQETLRHYFPDLGSEVQRKFAGLRVLPSADSSVFRRSRETVFHRDPQLPRLVAIYGGKLTGYRAAALKAMACLEEYLPIHSKTQDTAKLLLHPQ